MRRIKRKIALARMKAEGIQHPIRRRTGLKGERLPSYFADHWREYIGGKKGA